MVLLKQGAAPDRWHLQRGFPRVTRDSVQAWARHMHSSGRVLYSAQSIKHRLQSTECGVRTYDKTSILISQLRWRFNVCLVIATVPLPASYISPISYIDAHIYKPYPYRLLWTSFLYQSRITLDNTPYRVLIFKNQLPTMYYVLTCWQFDRHVRLAAPLPRGC